MDNIRPTDEELETALTVLVWYAAFLKHHEPQARITPDKAHKRKTDNQIRTRRAMGKERL